MMLHLPPKELPIIPFPQAAHDVELWFPSTPYTRRTEIHEMQYLCWLSKYVTGNIVELGCNWGLTSLQLACHNPDKLIFGVDFVGEPTMDERQANEQPSTITDIGRHARDRQNFWGINSKTAEVNYDDFEPVSLIFIDADHRYEGVKADTEHALEHLLKKQSKDHRAVYIVWHDYYPEGLHGWMGVRRYLTSELAYDFDLQHIDTTCMVQLGIHQKE